MSKKNTKTTCSGIEWNAMLGLLSRLKKDKRIKEYLLIGSGSYLGLRASDLLKLKWSNVLNTNEILIIEQKTGKTRQIILSDSVKEIFEFVSNLLIKEGKFNNDNYLFANRQNGNLSIQYVNRLLKKVVNDYGIKVQNASTHTLRKTFGKRVWEMDGKSERGLIYLSQIFNHSNTGITRRYIGIIEQDIQNIYLNL